MNEGHIRAAKDAARAHELRGRIAELRAELAEVDARAEAWRKHVVDAQVLADGDHLDAGGEHRRGTRREVGESVQHLTLSRERTLLHVGSGSLKLTVHGGASVHFSEGGMTTGTVRVGETREFRTSVWARSEAASSVSVAHVAETVEPADRDGARYPLLTAFGWVHKDG